MSLFQCGFERFFTIELGFWGHTQPLPPPCRDLRPWSDPSPQRGNFGYTLGQLKQAIMLQAFPFLITKCLGSK